MNMAINLLGAYVHTNRLQFVEFFGKFYEARPGLPSLPPTPSISKSRRKNDMNSFDWNTLGIVFALLGGMLAALMAGIGSAVGVAWPARPLPAL